MKFPDNKISKIKNIFLENGIKEFNFGDFKKYLTQKSPNRYLVLIKSMRSYNMIAKEGERVSLNMETLQFIYKLDVKLRRMFSELLKPIELTLRYQLAVLIDRLENIFSDKVFYDLNPDFSRKNSAKKTMKTLNTRLWIKKSIIAICKKNNIYDIELVMGSSTFGQIAAIISQLDKENITKLFGDDSMISGNINEILETLREFRNAIAHHQIILSNKGIRKTRKNKNNQKFLKYESIISNIGDISRDNGSNFNIDNEITYLKNNSLESKASISGAEYNNIFLFIKYILCV